MVAVHEAIQPFHQAAAFLRELRDDNIKVWKDGNEVNFSAPTGKMTPGRMSVFRTVEPQLRELLAVDGAEMTDEAMAERAWFATLPKPKLEEVVVGTLVVPAYQRSLNDGRIRQMARDLHPLALGEIVVSRREDGDYVVDGQHRVETIRQTLGDHARMIALVYENLSIEQEATIFSLRQSGRSRKPMTASEQFLADVIRGDPLTLRIKEIVEESGYRIQANPGGSINGAIKAVGALVRIATNRRTGHAGTETGFWALRTTLGLCREAWGLDVTPPSSIVLEGIAAFLSRHRDAKGLDRGRVLRILQATNARQLETRGREVAAYHATPMNTGVALHLYRQYNKGLGSKTRLPEWDPSRRSEAA